MGSSALLLSRDAQLLITRTLSPSPSQGVIASFLSFLIVVFGTFSCLVVDGLFELELEGRVEIGVRGVAERLGMTLFLSIGGVGDFCGSISLIGVVRGLVAL